MMNYLLDILSQGSQLTDNHTTRSNFMDSPFTRPEDTEMIANIIMLTQAYRSSYERTTTIQSPRARHALFCAATERLESTEWILHSYFSSMPETYLISLVQIEVYEHPQTIFV